MSAGARSADFGIQYASSQARVKRRPEASGLGRLLSATACVQIQVRAQRLGGRPAVGGRVLQAEARGCIRIVVGNCRQDLLMLPTDRVQIELALVLATDRALVEL